jgi:hypothetical protein
MMSPRSAPIAKWPGSSALTDQMIFHSSLSPACGAGGTFSEVMG